MTAAPAADDLRPPLIDRPPTEAVVDLAAEMFAIQVVGERRAFDTATAVEPLVYRTLINGVVVQDGHSNPDPSMPFSGVLASIRMFFEFELRMGNNVIVWRTMPLVEGDRMRFRCAFTSTSRLRINQPKEF